MENDFLAKARSVGTVGVLAVYEEFPNDKKFTKQVEQDVMDLVSYAAELDKMAKRDAEFSNSDSKIEYDKLRSKLSELHPGFKDLPNIN